MKVMIRDSSDSKEGHNIFKQILLKSKDGYKG